MVYHINMSVSVDILSIDSNIKQTFRDNIEKLPQYEANLLDLQQTSKHYLSTHSTVRKDLEDNIVDVKSKIQNIKERYDMNFYIAETSYLIDSYKKILKTPVKTSFVGKEVKNNNEKNDIIIKYLEIAQKYLDINIELPEKDNKVICNNCQNKKSFDVIDNSIYICTLCGAQQEVILHTSSYKDVDRINISTKYTYDRKVHFRDCINQYQGKQNCAIDPKIFIDLEDQFKKHHLLIGDEKTPKKERFANITKEHIHLFLKELEYTKHYENVNLIHWQMTDKKPDDISYLEHKLLEDFDILAELYDKKFKNKPGFDRKNFINTQYILFELLSKYKHPCKKEDFTILKTVDRKFFHDTVSRELFETLEWSHVSLVG